MVVEIISTSHKYCTVKFRDVKNNFNSMDRLKVRASNNALENAGTSSPFYIYFGTQVI